MNSSGIDVFNFICCILLLLTKNAFGSGDLSIGFMAYTGHSNRLALGQCCHGYAYDDVCRDPCDLLFDVSILDPNGTILVRNKRPSETPIRVAGGDVIFPLPFLDDGFRNPIALGLPKITPRTLLSIQVYHVDFESIILTPGDLHPKSVDNMTFTLNLDEPSDFFHCRDVQGTGRPSTRLKLALRYACHPLYAGADCSVDCLNSPGSPPCLRQALGSTDNHSTQWHFSSPLARCPAPPIKPGGDNVTSTSAPVTMTTMTSRVVDSTTTLPTSEQSMFSESTIVTTKSTSDVVKTTASVAKTQTMTSRNVVNTPTTTISLIETSKMAESSRQETHTTNIDSVKSTMTPSALESEDPYTIPMTSRINTSSMYATVPTSQITPTRIHETLTTQTELVNSMMTTSVHGLQSTNDLSKSTTTTPMHTTTTMTESSITSNPTVSSSIGSISKSTFGMTSSMTISKTEILDTNTQTIISPPKTSAGITATTSKITTSFTMGTQTTWSSDFQPSATITDSLPTIGISTTSTQQETRYLTSSTPHMPSTKIDMTTTTKSTTTSSATLATSLRITTTPTTTAVSDPATKTTATPTSPQTAKVDGSSTTSPGKVPTGVSRKTTPPQRAATTNRIVQPTFPETDDDSSDPMQFWAIIVGSVLGSLAIIGILGYAIYRSRQRTIQRRQEIYTVTPQMTSTIEENGTSGRSDVPMTTALL